jgi:hypothetical protein
MADAPADPDAGVGDDGQPFDAVDDGLSPADRAIAKRLSMIEAGRRKGGVLGAAAAGAMLGIRDVYEGPPKEDKIVEVAESPGEPGDIDVDGIEVSVGDVDVWAPPPPRRDGFDAQAD